MLSILTAAMSMLRAATLTDYIIVHATLGIQATENLARVSVEVARDVIF